MSTRIRTFAAALTLLAAGSLLAAGCSDDDGGGDEAGGTTTTEASSTTEAPKTLEILVSNDDGFEAEGIDAVVEALGELPDVELQVVAPATQQSGTGGKTTSGALTATEEKLKSGHEVTAVNGFPADAVNYAFDELEVDPHLVVTGINEGQNLGPVVDASGTVGAARAAVAHGVPALASSQGLGDFDYETGAKYVTDWVTEQRDALLEGTAEVQVSNMNIPSCGTGEVHGLKEVPVSADGTNAIKPQDCASTATPEDNDVSAFNLGWVTLSVVPDEPATPPQVVPGTQPPATTAPAG